jgi:hypothetical protein
MAGTASFDRGTRRYAASTVERSLRILLTRISNSHHRLTVVRADGTQESRELETRSCLLHDLVHFAVETEARLAESFWGLLARGVRHAELADVAAMHDADELHATESVVAALQGALATQTPPAEFVASFTAALRSIDAAPPAWLTVDLVRRVLERLRRLRGHCRATPFGQAMELRFDPTETTGSGG